MLTRAEFCKLTDLSVDDLKNRARYNQLPFVADEERRHMPGSAGLEGPEYSPFEAFLTLISLDLAQNTGIGFTKAAEITRDLPQNLWLIWPEIAGTSEDLYSGHAVEAEIMCGRAELAGMAGNRPVAGTLSNISAKLLAPQVPTIRLTLTNASRAAAVLRMRAARNKLDLGADFWTFVPDVGTKHGPSV